MYERILNRIKKPRVKALAYPGVVLRRVTPELILKVLAPTCPVPLDVTTPADAEQAFNELAEHVWLVTRIAPDTVVHRADVRRLLVPGLEHSSDVDTRAIHRRGRDVLRRAPDLGARRTSPRSRRSTTWGCSTTSPRTCPKVWRRRSSASWRPTSSTGRCAPARRSSRSPGATSSSPRKRWPRSQHRDRSATRGFRLEKRLDSSDIGSAAFEEAQLGLLGEDEDTTAAIPDSRWRLLFDRGDFEFMTEASRVLTAYDRYFTADPSQTPSSSPTHEHPWFIALAILLVERGERPVFSETALAALDSSWDEARRYGAALAALAGDAASPRQDHSTGGACSPRDSI